MVVNSDVPIALIKVFAAFLVVCVVLWLFLPIWQVRRAEIQDAKQRLELQDAFRKTLAQALGGFAFLLTFGLSVEQFLENQRASLREFSAKAKQTVAKDHDDASALLKPAADDTTLLQALAKLERIALQDDPSGIYLETVSRQVEGLIEQRTRKENITTSQECVFAAGSVPANAPVRPDREQFDPISLSAIKTLNRLSNASKSPLSLSHIFLDNIKLNDVTFSPFADFSQSRLRRSNFRGAHLPGANFSGASFADYNVPGFTNEVGEALKLRTMPEWQIYRCWAADFTGAELRGARFSGAGLGSAIFANTKLDGTQFNGAVLSRADFRGSDITREQLENACADDPILSDIGFQPPSCNR